MLSVDAMFEGLSPEEIAHMASLPKRFCKNFKFAEHDGKACIDYDIMATGSGCLKHASLELEACKQAVLAALCIAEGERAVKAIARLKASLHELF